MRTYTEKQFARAALPPLTVHLYPAQGACRGIVYAHVTGADEAACADALPADIAFAALAGEDWDADLSPWAAPRAFAKGEDFLGRAPAYLAFLCGTVLPQCEAALGLAAPCRALAGYSLAGLFGVYALYRCDKFNVLACMSGSLWFDGFAAYLAAHRPVTVPSYAYFSLGDREPRARDARLAAVGPATEQAIAQLRALGVPVDFRWESGGHFPDIPGRCARGIAAAAAHLQT